MDCMAAVMLRCKLCRAARHSAGRWGADAEALTQLGMHNVQTPTEVCPATSALLLVKVIAIASTGINTYQLVDAALPVQLQIMYIAHVLTCVYVECPGDQVGPSTQRMNTTRQQHLLHVVSCLSGHLTHSVLTLGTWPMYLSAR